MYCLLLTQSSQLTLKNLSRLQVASIYKDPSIGNLINIVIVNLVVIHNEQVIKFFFFFLVYVSEMAYLIGVGTMGQS